MGKEKSAHGEMNFKFKKPKHRKYRSAHRHGWRIEGKQKRDNYFLKEFKRWRYLKMKFDN